MLVIDFFYFMKENLRHYRIIEKSVQVHVDLRLEWK